MLNSKFEHIPSSVTAVEFKGTLKEAREYASRLQDAMQIGELGFNPYSIKTDVVSTKYNGLFVIHIHTIIDDKIVDTRIAELFDKAHALAEQLKG